MISNVLPKIFTPLSAVLAGLSISQANNLPLAFIYGISGFVGAHALSLLYKNWSQTMLTGDRPGI